MTLPAQSCLTLLRLTNGNKVYLYAAQAALEQSASTFCASARVLLFCRKVSQVFGWQRVPVQQQWIALLIVQHLSDDHCAHQRRCWVQTSCTCYI